MLNDWILMYKVINSIHIYLSADKVIRTTRDHPSALVSFITQKSPSVEKYCLFVSDFEVEEDSSFHPLEDI